MDFIDSFASENSVLVFNSSFCLGAMMAEKSIRELLQTIAGDIGVPYSSIEKYAIKLEEELIFKAGQISGFSSQRLYKELGLPLGISLRMEEYLKEGENPILRPNVTQKKEKPKRRQSAHSTTKRKISNENRFS